MSWRLLYAKQAVKDAKKLSASGLKPKAEELLRILSVDPYQNPPPFEKLVRKMGDRPRFSYRRTAVQGVAAKEKPARCAAADPH